MSTTIQQRLDRFTTRELSFNKAALAPDVQAALPHLVEAMRGMDRLYRQQLGPEVVALFEEHDDDSVLARALRHFNSPWDKLDEGAPFVPGVDEALPGKALYPTDITEAELDAWLDAHPDQRAALLHMSTVVERDGDTLIARPYSEVYRSTLEQVATALRAAADLLEHQGLATFLRHRALALLDDFPFNESEAEWVRLTDAPLEVVIGPAEVYADELKGAKAFYEGMLLAVDHEAGAKLATIEAHIHELSKLVPLPDGSRGAIGTQDEQGAPPAGIAPMVIADEIIATGDGYAGILASAFNLPNDPGVRSDVGWKQIMIRNVMEAKFEACTSPIARRVLAEHQVDDLSFDSYFYFVLLHEVSHSLGPMYRADGRTTNEACGKHYTPLEEAKADTGALVLLLARHGQYGIPAMTPQQIGASYLAGIYRSSRFGLNEAHGKANVIQYSWFRRHGAFTGGEDGGRLSVDVDRLREAASALLQTLCGLQASGDQAALAAFLDDHGTPPDDLIAALDRISDLPIDIVPVYPEV